MPPKIPEPLGLYAQLACIWEATARKPGNVHRFRDFADVRYVDFIASAAAIAPVFDRIVSSTAGAAILDAINSTSQVSPTNTNLGIVLLLAPLALAENTAGLRTGVSTVLEQLTVKDAELAYQAIRLARPSGLGHVDEQDIERRPTRTLREVMALAADRDLIAAQYANGFREVFEDGVPSLQRGLEENECLEDAVIGCHLNLLAQHPDSLIARKCGREIAEEARRRASEIMSAGWPRTANGRDAITDFDNWLREDGHRRNPGSTADLVAAALFAALREGIIKLPLQALWSESRAPS